MKIVVDELVINDKYSKYAPEELKVKGQPIVSFPFEITEFPEETQSFCFTLIDYDAVPLAGFPWIHWIVGNVETKNSKIIEDFSRDKTIFKVQGKNSLVSPYVGETDPQITQHYVGPTPPDKTHNYTLTVYALNSIVPLGDGFYLNELLEAMEGLVIDEAKIVLQGRS